MTHGLAHILVVEVGPVRLLSICCAPTLTAGLVLLSRISTFSRRIWGAGKTKTETSPGTNSEAITQTFSPDNEITLYRYIRMMATPCKATLTHAKCPDPHHNSTRTPTPTRATPITALAIPPVPSARAKPPPLLDEALAAVDVAEPPAPP